VIAEDRQGLRKFDDAVPNARALPPARCRPQCSRKPRAWTRRLAGSCRLPGTQIAGLDIAFMADPDGAVIEYVERPLSHFAGSGKASKPDVLGPLSQPQRVTGFRC